MREAQKKIYSLTRKRNLLANPLHNPATARSTCRAHSVRSTGRTQLPWQVLYGPLCGMGPTRHGWVYFHSILMSKMGVIQKMKPLAQWLHKALAVQPGIDTSSPAQPACGQDLPVWGDTPYFINASLSSAPLWKYLLVHSSQSWVQSSVHIKEKRPCPTSWDCLLMFLYLQPGVLSSKGLG